MKECKECGKKLGIIEGFRHPTMGIDHLLCSSCYDKISVSVERWSEAISQYLGFFNKESSTIEDIQKIEEYITKNIKNIQNKVSNLRLNKTNKNVNEILSTIH